jgi:hypothetical protein
MSGRGMETAGPFARPHDLAILCYIEHRGLEGGTLLANAVNHEIARRSRLGKVSSLGILIRSNSIFISDQRSKLSDQWSMGGN